jgi:Flp pilus assembly protein TadB
MTVSRVLFASAAVCIVVGVALLIAGVTLVGAIVLGVGLLDAVLAPGAARMERRQGQQRSPSGL